MPGQLLSQVGADPDYLHRRQGPESGTCELLTRNQLAMQPHLRKPVTPFLCILEGLRSEFNWPARFSSGQNLSGRPLEAYMKERGSPVIFVSDQIGEKRPESWSRFLPMGLGPGRRSAASITTLKPLFEVRGSGCELTLNLPAVRPGH